MIRLPDRCAGEKGTAKRGQLFIKIGGASLSATATEWIILNGLFLTMLSFNDNIA